MFHIRYRDTPGLWFLVSVILSQNNVYAVLFPVPFTTIVTDEYGDKDSGVLILEKFVIPILRYVLVLLRKTQNAPTGVVGADEGRVSALNPLFVIL